MSKRLRIASIAALAFAAAVSGAVAGPDSVVDFDIPAGDLAGILTTISRLGSTPLSYSAELTRGLSGPALHGRSTVKAAVDKVLAGTGLRAVGSSGGIILERTGGASTANIATDISDVNVTGDGLNPFQDNGFQAGDAGTALRLANTSVKEVPRSVTTVTKDVLKAEGITTVSNAVQNVAGVNLAPGQIGQPTFTIRGFKNQAGIYVNGFSSGGATGQIPIDDVERIDVIKGPTSILTGANVDGGAVIAETKRPTDTVIHDATVRFGSFNYATLAFDYGGPVPNTEGVTYRFNISGNKAEKNYAGYLHPHEYLVSPVVQWKDQFTSILIGAQYYDQRVLAGQFSFVPTFDVNPSAPEIRTTRGVPFVNPNLGSNTKTLTLYSEQSHNFGSVFGLETTVNNRFQFMSSKANANYQRLNRGFFLYVNGLVSTSQVESDSDVQTFGDRSDVTFTYDAGFARQTSKFGFDFNLQRADSAFDQARFQQLDPFTGYPFYPIFSVVHPQASMSHSVTNDFGYYYLEKFDTLGDRLHIVGQARYDQNLTAGNTTSGTVGTDSSGAFGRHSEGLSWTAGGVFDLFPWMSLYGSRSAGYTPAPGSTSITHLPYPPEGRDNSEVGARYFLFDKNVTLTTSFFDLLQTNVATSLDGGYTFVLTPGQRSRGFEIEAQGQVFPGFNVTASFSDVNTRYVDNVLGYSLPGVPQYIGNILATYTVQNGALKGFTAGFGVHGNSRSIVADNTTTNGPTYKVPGYILTDLVFGYARDKYSITLNVNNIFDKYFYFPSYDTRTIIVGQGRNFLLTGRYSFD